MALLELKRRQLGLTKVALADAIGISISSLQENAALDGQARPFREDIMAHIASSPTLSFSEPEYAHLAALNGQLVGAGKKVPNHDITDKQIAACATLGEFLNLKAEQIGLDKMALHPMAQVAQTTMAAIRNGRDMARQLTPLSLEELARGLKLSPAEADLMQHLNEKLTPAQNKYRSTQLRQERAEATPPDWSETLAERLFMRHYTAEPEGYILPTPELLAAFDAADAQTWNRLRDAAPLPEGTMLYLRGYSGADGSKLRNVSGFNLSNTDLTDVQWAPALRLDGATFSGAWLADAGRDPAIYTRQLDLLPLTLRRAHEHDNPPSHRVSGGATQGRTHIEKIASMTV